MRKFTPSPNVALAVEASQSAKDSSRLRGLVGRPQYERCTYPSGGTTFRGTSSEPRPHPSRISRHTAFALAGNWGHTKPASRTTERNAGVCAPCIDTITATHPSFHEIAAPEGAARAIPISLSRYFFDITNCSKIIRNMSSPDTRPVGNLNSSPSALVCKWHSGWPGVAAAESISYRTETPLGT